jgi:predicted dienelactone hydrolase
MAAMRKAANEQNFLLRVRDVPAVLDQLELWNREKSNVLEGRMNLNSVGMSGHSFGAVTTQALSGQATVGGRSILPDVRIKAAVIMSPSSPRRGSPRAAFGHVTLPWLLMTGTKDTSRIGTTDLNSRLAVFPALPPGGKYELVLYEAQHSAFTDGTLPGNREPRNPNHHRSILALTTAFWDTYLRNDPAAEEWLLGDGPKSVLEENDRWQTK